MGRLDCKSRLISRLLAAKGRGQGEYYFDVVQGVEMEGVRLRIEMVQLDLSNMRVNLFDPFFL